MNSFSAFACSCVEPGTPWEQLAWADAVFAGTVIDVDNPYPDDNGFIYGGETVQVSFTVEKYWKGVMTEPIIIYTGQGNGDCGIPFEEGESYLVYAYIDDEGDYPDGNLHANMCSRTALLYYAEEDLTKLGKWKIPNEDISTPLSFIQRSQEYYEYYFNVFIFIVILLLIFFILLKHYYSRPYTP